jgi:hypothetical protein
MFPGFDPQLMRDLTTVKTLVNLSHQSPTREWPLVFVEDHDALLVVREWPSGEVTAYWASTTRDR